MPPRPVGPPTWLKQIAFAVPLAVFLLVYAPAVGRGFISDDFGWIVQSRVHSLSDGVALFEKNHGFYRPIVALTFAVDYALFGNRPLGYGLTNLALCLLCAVLIAMMFRAFGLTRSAAIFGAGVWLLNFHGINMALLWMSGRSALLLVAAAAAAVLALLRGRVLLSIGCLVLALFSKEEAVLLPVVMLAWLAANVRDGRTAISGPAAVLLILGILLDLAVYAWLRIHSGAMTPATAPFYYRFTFLPAALLRNIMEYADRGSTFAAAVTLIAWAVLRPGARVPIRWRVIGCGFVWLVCGYAITVFLPSRSSLYACFPAVGAALVSAEICSQLWAAAQPTARLAGLVTLAMVPILCAPVYVMRNQRWVDLAKSSSVALTDVATFTTSLPPGSTLVLVDDRSRPINIHTMFGTLLSDAVSLATGRRFEVWVESPPGDAAVTNIPQPCSGCETVRMRLRDGHITLSQQ